MFQCYSWDWCYWVAKTILAKYLALMKSLLVWLPRHFVALFFLNYVVMLSAFNMVGRFIWASTSDYIGRKNTYHCFFVLSYSVFFYSFFAIEAQIQLPLFTSAGFV